MFILSNVYFSSYTRRNSVDGCNPIISHFKNCFIVLFCFNQLNDVSSIFKLGMDCTILRLMIIQSLLLVFLLSYKTRLIWPNNPYFTHVKPLCLTQICLQYVYYFVLCVLNAFHTIYVNIHMYICHSTSSFIKIDEIMYMLWKVHMFTYEICPCFIISYSFVI